MKKKNGLQALMCTIKDLTQKDFKYWINQNIQIVQKPKTMAKLEIFG